ncbi:MAG: hypothetical protein ABIQ55_00840 [Gemmatimonadaceae bacterium]
MTDRSASPDIREPRSAEFTRPLRLGPLAIIAGLTTTIVLIFMLSMGVGRSRLGFAPPMAPGRIEMRVKNPGGSSAFAFRRQIAMTRDGSGVVYVLQTGAGEDVLATQELDSETPVIGDEGDSIEDGRSDKAKAIESAAMRAVAANAVEIRYAAGHIVYVRPDGSLWAAPFNRNTNRVTAEPVQIGSNVALTQNGIAQFALSKNGNVAYLPEGPRSLVIVTREGRLHNVTDEHRLYSNPRFSPDARRISVDIADEEGRDIWTVPVEGGKLTRATFARDAHDAAWTPDAKFITWTSYRLGALGIYRSRPGVNAKPDSVFTDPTLVYSGEWLKDGSGIVTVATSLKPSSRFDIAFVSNEGRGPILPILADGFDTRSPAVSRDGKWLAYMSNQGGRDEVYVRPWNSDGAPWRISASGGTEPVWGPGGAMLFYRESSRQFLMAASLLLSANHVFVPIKVGLFPIDAMNPGFTHANFDIAPDGHSFVMIFHSAPRGITVLKNIPKMLKGSSPGRETH